MRSLLALALVLAACGPADRSDPSASHDAPSATPARGPDPLILRVERSGGRARVYAYDRLDSLLWSAPGMPRIADIVGFDPEQGVISFVDGRNVPGRIDLRTDGVSQAGSRFTLTGARTADGGAVYGVAGGRVVRFTDAGPWEFDPDRDVTMVFPQDDGAIVALSRPREGSAQLWRLFPPQEKVTDSAVVDGLAEGPRVQGGDRIYLATAGGLAVINARTLEVVAPVALETPARDAVGTPSGDRLFVALEAESQLAVYERYRGELGAGVELPGAPRALRMDPLGRYLIVRPTEGDSAWVVAVGTRKLIGTVRTAWRRDLPFVGADGRVATAQGDDVVFVDGSTMRATGRVAGGTADFWYPFQWSGFRPRAAGIDRPVEFGVADSAADSAAAPPDSTAPSASPSASPTTPEAPTAGPQWVVSFAALLVETSAQALAEEITVEGQRARVVTSLRDGAPVHRVVIGPFGDRDAAERVGRASGRPYWVYAATP